MSALVTSSSINSARDITTGALFNNTTGNISLRANVGTLQVNSSINGRGDVTIRHTGVALQDKIVLGAFASIQAVAPSVPQGNVLIAITNQPITNSPGTVPVGGTVTQITSGGGQIFFGPAPFTNSGSTTLNAKGANITFFRDAGAAEGVNAIQLNSNFIFADPPAPGVAPAAIQAAPVLHHGAEGGVPIPTSSMSVWSNSQAANMLPMKDVYQTYAPVATNSAVQTNSAMATIAAVQTSSAVASTAAMQTGSAMASTTAMQTGSAMDTTAAMQTGSAMDTTAAMQTGSAMASTEAMQTGSAMASTAAMQTGSPMASTAAMQTGSANSSVLTGFVAKKAGFLIGKTPGYLKTEAGASVKRLNENSFELEHGEVVIGASRQSTIHSGNHVIQIAQGAIVHATRNGCVLKVRNLCDTTGSAVRLTIGDRTVNLSAGEELVVAPDLATAEAAIKADNVGRRNANRYVLDGKSAIVKTELSIITLIQRSTLLSNMYSNGSAADRIIMERVMKMAAALFQVTGRRGAYSAYDPARENRPIALSNALPRG